MDDISALEEMTPQVLTSDLKLFDTRPAIEWKMADYRGFIGSALFFSPNAPSGLLLDIFAKNSGPVRVTVADKAGNPRSPVHRARGGRRDYARGPGIFATMRRFRRKPRVGAADGAVAVGDGAELRQRPRPNRRLKKV